MGREFNRDAQDQQDGDLPVPAALRIGGLDADLPTGEVDVIPAELKKLGSDFPYGDDARIRAMLRP